MNDASLLNITFLGTGTSQGVPVIGCDCEVCTSTDPRDKKLRCSIWVTKGDTSIVVDAGPDFRQQMLRAGVKKLDAILITHEHNDHIIGLDDVRPFNFMHWQNMPVYATKRVQKELKERFAYIFEENPYPGAPMLQLINIQEGTDFTVKDVNITPIKVMHGKLPVMGFRFDDFTYLTDVKTISESEREKAKNSEVLVISALHYNRHHSHMNLEEALEMIDRLQPKQAYLIHTSHRMGRYEDVSKTLPENVALAYDGLELKI